MQISSYWTAPDTGVRYATLPRQWHGICPLTPARAIPAGWRKSYEAVPSTTCTKYAFTKAVKQYSSDLWDKLYIAYYADEEFSFYWNTVVMLDRTEARFLYLAEKLGATSDDLDGVFHAVDYPDETTTTTAEGISDGTTDTEAEATEGGTTA